MNRGSFIFDGVTSESLHAVIQTRPLIEAPQRKVNMKSVYGMDGNMPYDESAYDNTSMELAMIINGSDVIADRQALYNLLDTQGIYKDFIPYFDPDKTYRVMLSDAIQFDHQYNYGGIQLVSAKFTVKPYKYLVSNDPVIIDGTIGSVTNPTNYVSQPIITIQGTGAVTLTVNGFDFNIINVQDTITLSSERQAAYQEYVPGLLTSMNSQVATRDYPVLKPGVNSISATGNVTQITIEPRWRSLV
jgi:phage-related protein